MRELSNIVVLFAALLLSCCGSRQLESQNKNDRDWKSSLQGVWAASDTARMSFKVVGDSLLMFEDPAPVFFEIKRDSFIYYFDGMMYFNRILLLRPDTLVFIENGDTLKLYKVR